MPAATSEDQGELSEEVDSVILDLEHPKRKVQVGISLPEEIRDQIVKVLLEFVDVFSWKPEDMTGLSFELTMHKLNIDPGVKPIRQKSAPLHLNGPK